MAFLAGSSIYMQPRQTLVTSNVSGLKLASFMKHGKSSLSFTMRRRPMPARLQICCAAATIEDRVRRVVSEQLGVKEEEVVAVASFVEDLGADDADAGELVRSLEKEFDMEISDEDAKKITTVQAAVDYIKDNSA